MKTLEDNLSDKQKEILNLIRVKELDNLLNNYSWGLISNSILTFECLGLTHFNTPIYYPEQLKQALDKQ